jgi:prevent-host-death family protein
MDAIYAVKVRHSHSLRDAKRNLSKLVAAVERGEQVELRRGGVPVARLVPVAPPTRPRKPGALSGSITMADDFDTLPDDVARALGMID